MAKRRVRRELNEIEPALRDKIRDLLTGKIPWPLYIHGPAGTGKTSAALCVLDYCGRPSPVESPHYKSHQTQRQQEEAELSIYGDWNYGFLEIRNLCGIKINTEEHLWIAMLRCWQSLPLVVIDEIGIQGGQSDFRLDATIELLNMRADDPVRPLIVTGNVLPSALPDIYDERVADRILCGTQHYLNGRSRRMPNR